MSFVVAPGAFSVLASRDQAGAMVSYSLTRMHWLGLACGVVILLFRLIRTQKLGSLVAPSALLVLLMILLTAASQAWVSPKMAALRVQMGSIQAATVNSPLLAEFSRLHRISVSLESGVLIAGFATLFLFVREAASLPTP